MNTVRIGEHHDEFDASDNETLHALSETRFHVLSYNNFSILRTDCTIIPTLMSEHSFANCELGVTSYESEYYSTQILTIPLFSVHVPAMPVVHSLGSGASNCSVLLNYLQ